MHWLTRAIAWTDANSRLVDGLLVLLFVIPGLLTTALLPLEGSESAPNALAYIVAVLAAATLFWRRTQPLIALPTCAALIIVYWVGDFAGAVDTVLWIMFYSATRHGGPNRTLVWRVVGAALAAILFTATIGVIVPTEDLPFIAVIGIFFIHGAAAAIGEALYQRSQHVRELEQRAAALEADLETKAALAAVEERTRIAREMHDIIAHGMSTVVVQAQAGQSILETDPQQARQVFKTIEGIGRNSVDEMRRMLGVLRNATGELELEPQPGFEDFDSLQQQIAGAGIDVDITLQGSPRPLPPGLELAGYRVVQEALTNVVRHAGRPAKARAIITYGDDALEIEVADDGLGAAASPVTSGTGHGLLGMRERVEIYSGSFAAGPRPGGGYQVAVSLPIPSRVDA